MIDEKKLIKVIEEEIAYQNENGFYHLEIKGLEYALKLVKMQQKEDGWIPFECGYNPDTKRTELMCGLPDDGEDVLVTNGKHVWSDTFFNGDCCYFDSGSIPYDEATAWMPLPEPPKESKDEV